MLSDQSQLISNGFTALHRKQICFNTPFDAGKGFPLGHGDKTALALSKSKTSAGHLAFPNRGNCPPKGGTPNSHPSSAGHRIAGTARLKAVLQTRTRAPQGTELRELPA